MGRLCGTFEELLFCVYESKLMVLCTNEQLVTWCRYDNGAAIFKLKAKDLLHFASSFKCTYHCKVQKITFDVDGLKYLCVFKF